MRAVLQRVDEARVAVVNTAGQEQIVGQISRGWLVFLGVSVKDTVEDAAALADKTINLRAFPDIQGKMNLSVQDIGGEILVVSQFTLYGDCRKGRRPSFVAAAPPERAAELYGEYSEQLRRSGLRVANGQFQADMRVSLVNVGPVTLMLDSHKEF